MLSFFSPPGHDQQLRCGIDHQINNVVAKSVSSVFSWSEIKMVYVLVRQLSQNPLLLKPSLNMFCFSFTENLNVTCLLFHIHWTLKLDDENNKKAQDVLHNKKQRAKYIKCEKNALKRTAPHAEKHFQTLSWEDFFCFCQYSSCVLHLLCYNHWNTGLNVAETCTQCHPGDLPGWWVSQCWVSERF